MDSSVTPVKHWRAVARQDAIAQIRREQRYAITSQRLHAGEVSPISLYCYLKTRFGKPNGEVMALRSKGSDNLLQWHYKLASNAFVLDVLGTNAGLQFIAHGTAPVAADAWLQMFRELEAEFAAMGANMGAARRGLEKWVLFVNPFQRLEHAVATLETELKALDTTPPIWPPGPSEAEAAEYLESLRNYSEASIRATTTGFCLCLLAPIYAESFVNFVLYFFPKGAMTDSDEKYREVVRLPVRERVLSLPSNSQGFAAPLDDDAVEYREFLRLMNGRNDLVHGNCDPARLKVGDLFFDGTIPLWQHDGSTIVRLLQQSMKHVAKDDALKDVESVRAFIRWVLRSMEPRWSDQLRQLMVSKHLGVRGDTGRVGILLPNNVYEAYGRGAQAQ